MALVSKEFCALTRGCTDFVGVWERAYVHLEMQAPTLPELGFKGDGALLPQCGAYLARIRNRCRCVECTTKCKAFHPLARAFVCPACVAENPAKYELISRDAAVLQYAVGKKGLVHNVRSAETVHRDRVGTRSASVVMLQTHAREYAITKHGSEEMVQAAVDNKNETQSVKTAAAAMRAAAAGGGAAAPGEKKKKARPPLLYGVNPKRLRFNPEQVLRLLPEGANADADAAAAAAPRLTRFAAEQRNLEKVAAWNTKTEKKTRSLMTRGAIEESRGKFKVYDGQDVSGTLTMRLGNGDVVTAISDKKERKREKKRVAAAATKDASEVSKKASGGSQHASDEGGCSDERAC